MIPFLTFIMIPMPPYFPPLSSPLILTINLFVLFKPHLQQTCEAFIQTLREEARGLLTIITFPGLHHGDCGPQAYTDMIKHTHGLDITVTHFRKIMADLICSVSKGCDIICLHGPGGSIIDVSSVGLVMAAVEALQPPYRVIAHQKGLEYVLRISESNPAHEKFDGHSPFTSGEVLWVTYLHYCEVNGLDPVTVKTSLLGSTSLTMDTMRSDVIVGSEQVYIICTDGHFALAILRKPSIMVKVNHSPL